MKKHTHCGCIIEFNQKPFVCGHDVYKEGEEEYGFTAKSAELAYD